MFTHILVPIDLSNNDRQRRALRTARDLAAWNRARVTLLHVVHHVPDIPLGELRGFYQRLVKTSRHRLALAAKEFTAKGLRVRAVVSIGEPAREILRVAEAQKVSLLVMGSHTVKSGRGARGLGTTSYKVGLVCRCPILLVK
jgi:nucleotide-binding universal stress UspA family protein